MTKKELIEFKQRLIKEKDYCEGGIDECETDDSLIYQGWTEALEFVLADKLLRRIR